MQKNKSMWRSYFWCNTINMFWIKTNIKKCALNSNKCVSFDYCDYAKGKDDEECNAFPVKTNENLCKKKLMEIIMNVMKYQI